MAAPSIPIIRTLTLLRQQLNAAFGQIFSDAQAFAATVTFSDKVGIGELSPDYKLDVNGAIGFAPGASVTPVDNGDVVFELTNNTTLKIKAKGSDGTVRTASVTLA